MIFFLSALFGQRIAFDVFLAVFEVVFCIFRVSRRIDDKLAQLCLKLFLGQRGKLFVEFLLGPLDIAENHGVSVAIRCAVKAALPFSWTPQSLRLFFRGDVLCKKLLNVADVIAITKVNTFSE